MKRMMQWRYKCQCSACATLILIFALAACSSSENKNPIHKVNDRLMDTSSVLTDRIIESHKHYIDALFAIESCEKYSKDPLVSCYEFRIELAKSAAGLCSLQAERSMLYRIIDSNGDSRKANLDLNESCEIEKQTSQLGKS